MHKAAALGHIDSIAYGIRRR